MDVLTPPVATDTATGGTPRLAVVVPAYNEQEVLLEFHRRLPACSTAYWPTSRSSM